MRISDWSSDVCSSDLLAARGIAGAEAFPHIARRVKSGDPDNLEAQAARRYWPLLMGADFRRDRHRSEEHTSELQSLMRISYAVFCLKKKNNVILRNTLRMGWVAAQEETLLGHKQTSTLQAVTL